MDAIIGRYRVRLEETGLTLKHTTGVSFDLTLEETIGLGDFIDAYRQPLIAMKTLKALKALESEIERETDPRIKVITSDEDDN